MYDDERVYYECKTCCYGVSASYASGVLWSKIGAHEEETGHVMDEVVDG